MMPRRSRLNAWPIVASAMGLLFLAFAARGAEIPPNPLTQYKERAKKLIPGGAQDWIQLSDFCQQNLLWTEQEEALRKALSINPGHAEARALLGERKFGSAWKPILDAVVEEVKTQRAKGLEYYGTQWMKPEQKKVFLSADRKTAGWDFEHRIDLPHVQVYSTESFEFTRVAAELGESAGLAYWRFYEKTWRMGGVPPLKLYLVPTKEAFASLTKQVARQSFGGNVCGYYDLGVKILFACSQSGKEYCLGTIVHEMIHALDDRVSAVYPNLPAWFGEGHGEYFNYGRRGLAVVPGKIHVDKSSPLPAILSGAADAPGLRDLMGRTNSTIRDGRLYLLAWSLVHCLYHGEGGKYRDKSLKYLSTLKTKKFSIDDFEAAVEKLDTLEPLVTKHIKSVMLPAVDASRKNDRFVTDALAGLMVK